MNVNEKVIKLAWNLQVTEKNYMPKKIQMSKLLENWTSKQEVAKGPEKSNEGEKKVCKDAAAPTLNVWKQQSAITSGAVNPSSSKVIRSNAEATGAAATSKIESVKVTLQ